MRTVKHTLAAALISALGLASCATLPTGPDNAFAIAESLACTQDQVTVADPTCLILTDPRGSDSADRASLIADALQAAGYSPQKVWAVPAITGDRVLGHGAVQNRGDCYRRRDCGEAFAYYVAVAVPTEDGDLQVIDPTVLDAPADRASWLSTLMLGGNGLANVRSGNMDVDKTVAGLRADGLPMFVQDRPEIARTGLKAAYCGLSKRRFEFRGGLALRGYTRPSRPDPSCKGS